MSVLKRYIISIDKRDIQFIQCQTDKEENTNERQGVNYALGMDTKGNFLVKVFSVEDGKTKKKKILKRAGYAIFWKNRNGLTMYPNMIINTEFIN